MKPTIYRQLTRSLAKVGILRRLFADPNEPEFFPSPQSVFDYQLKDLRKYADEFGRDINSYPGHLGRITSDELFSILFSFCSWKYINQQAMTPVERYTLALTGLSMEVNNGGFHQYFFNSAGDDWDALVWGFEASGDFDSLARFRKVLAIFPKGTPYRNRAFRWKQLETLGNREHELFEPHTKEFFDAPFPPIDKAHSFIFSKITDFQFTWPQL
jgi:hypothetical protein